MRKRTPRTILTGVGLVVLMGLRVSLSIPGEAAPIRRPSDVLSTLGQLSSVRHLETLIQGARTEGGRVVWFAGRNLDEVSALVQAFQARYPFMNVEVVRVGEGAAQRVLTEFRAGVATADVVDLNAAEVSLLAQAGALAAYTSPEATRIPDAFKDPAGRWTVVDLLPEVVAYNTRSITQRNILPQTFEELANPRWRGLLGRTTVGGPRWIAGMVTHFGERRGLELVRAIARNNVRLYTSNTALGVQLAQGEIALAFDLHITVPLREKGRGAPIDYYMLDDVAFLDPSLVAITVATPRPLGAALLVTWLLSQEGQRKALEITGGARMSTRPDIPYPHSDVLRNRKIVIYGPDLVGGSQFDRWQRLFNDLFVR